MKNRMSRCAALIGTLLSLSSFAQDCQEISLYGNGEIGNITASTFPENPEWAANWGTLDGMTPPYVRFSGQKNHQDDWSAELSFKDLPVKVQGGNLELKLRSTQKVKANVWIAGDFEKDNSYAMDMEPNHTYSVSIPVTYLAGAGVKTVSRVGVSLVGIPAYQYTTLFIDNVGFTCGIKGNDPSDDSNAENTELWYSYSDVEPSSPIREGKFLESKVGDVSAAYEREERDSLAALTQVDFVVSTAEQLQIMNYGKATDLTPQKSRDGWFRSLYQVDRNRLRDSVIANPKNLYYEAMAFAVGNDNSHIPLLLGNVDYGYNACVDTLCETLSVVPSRLLLAGLPVTSVNGSVVHLYYDPYFVTTNRKNLPSVEIYTGGSWVKMTPKSELKLEFESAGVQKVKVRLSEGGVTVNQNLFVEVK